MSETKRTNVKHLGAMNAVPAMIACAAAGVDPTTHTILTWHERPEIDKARAEGRIVARFVVRYGDPECYVVRHADETIAARTLGRKGGLAGRGASQRRGGDTPEQGLVTNTVGIGRQPWPTEAEARAWVAAH